MLEELKSGESMWLLHPPCWEHPRETAWNPARPPGPGSSHGVQSRGPTLTSKSAPGTRGPSLPLLPGRQDPLLRLDVALLLASSACRFSLASLYLHLGEPQVAAVLGAALPRRPRVLEGGRGHLAVADPGHNHARPHAPLLHALQEQEAGLPRGGRGGAPRPRQHCRSESCSQGALPRAHGRPDEPPTLSLALPFARLLHLHPLSPRRQDFLHRQPPLPHARSALGAHGLARYGHRRAVRGSWSS